MISKTYYNISVNKCKTKMQKYHNYLNKSKLIRKIFRNLINKFRPLMIKLYLFKRNKDMEELVHRSILQKIKSILLIITKPSRLQIEI